MWWGGENIPRECLDVTRSFEGLSAAMKMMQPFDLSVSVYGGDVWFSSESHYVPYHR